MHTIVRVIAKERESARAKECHMQYALSACAINMMMGVLKCKRDGKQDRCEAHFYAWLLEK